MAICQIRKEQRLQRRNQLDSANEGAPSAYGHDSEDLGDVIRTDVSDDCFRMISVALPSTAPPFSDVAPPSVRDPGLPRPFGLYRGVVVDERVCYWTEKHDKGVLDMQATIYDYDIDVLQKTTHARSLQYSEPTGSYEDVQEKKNSATSEPNASVYDHNNGDDEGDDDGDNNDEALLHAKDTEIYGNALLDLTGAEHDQLEGLQGGHYGPVVTTYGTPYAPGEPFPNKRFHHCVQRGARLSRGCTEDLGRPQPLLHQPVRSCAA
ncbi:uncharacterized protein LOC125943308 [Dermacentor silvarum]|uniref:uncharacterized protein LOC125943308 n=1 Tax=Dermacentor silvarum TaxID=543639 RepID=UPI002100E74D|nr:uncharacterized protein LOC125943308 [Dermacentor silvarum]XP_049518332.1 uncharacterized protein LOC125943308 [Dermacentor silvarum]